uniref:C-CAP/cofactor C-like domain-containing protein n=1 Tax=Mesocestoides corti TaxID=53468 RepID=A0A5K3FBI7_MESCO
MAEGASVPAGGMPAQLLERLAAREAQRKAAEHMSRRERRTVGEGLGGTGVDIQLPPLRLEPLNDDEAPVFTSPLHNTPSFFLEHMARAKALLLGRINRFCEACSTAEDSPSPSERTKTLDDLLSQIEELQRWFSESSPHLKPFHVEQARLDVEEIKARFHEVRETVLPKKKFKFGNKTTTDATKPKHSPQQAVSPLKAPVAGVVAVAPSKFTFSNLVDRDDLRLPAPGDPADALRDQSICLSDLTRCVVHVESISGNLMMNRLTGCTVYTRQPVASSVLLRNCTDCRFVLACRQLRIHQTRDTRLDIFVPSAPIIEDSCRLTVGPYTSCPSTREVFGEAENHWNHVQDFSCPTLVAENATKSPNWSLLPESDWLRDNQ